MRKLQYMLDIGRLRQIKDDIVPAIFTEHQFGLMEKRAEGTAMTPSEKNEFSRAVSRKMRAINSMAGEERNVFVYGRENILKSRLKEAAAYLREVSRKFRGKHVFISGSFLYNERYNDVDLFVVSNYDKEDCRDGKFHINYLAEDVYSSLFFASIKRLCISNRKIEYYVIEEKIDLDTFISVYQELFSDIEKKFKGARSTLREFLLQAAYISKSPLPDSLELKQQIDSILGKRDPYQKKSKDIIKKIFVNSVLIGIESKEAMHTMKDMIDSYNNIMKEYSQHKEYYLDLISAFQEVISVES